MRKDVIAARVAQALETQNRDVLIRCGLDEVTSIEAITDLITYYAQCFYCIAFCFKRQDNKQHKRLSYSHRLNSFDLERYLYCLHLMCSKLGDIKRFN